MPAENERKAIARAGHCNTSLKAGSS